MALAFSYILSYSVEVRSTGLGNSFVDYGDEQYNIKMESVIPRDYWRKGSQVIKAVIRS